MIHILDYNMGNLGSIQNMLKKIGVPSLITSKAEDLVKATKIILPGVGAFDEAMKNLKKLDIIKVLDEMVFEKGVFLLGICLGMQLLTKRSEEGELEGLGYIDAQTVRFNVNSKCKIPHMGWNTVNIKKNNNLFRDMSDLSRFYFVHSYFVKCSDFGDVLTTTQHGQDFCSSLNKENIYGVQFHPEKSHKFGMRLLKNFTELN